jgi:hypothetical protein
MHFVALSCVALTRESRFLQSATHTCSCQTTWSSPKELGFKSCSFSEQENEKCCSFQTSELEISQLYFPRQPGMSLAFLNQWKLSPLERN